MKKLITLVAALAMSFSLFGLDIFSYVQIKGNVKNYTQIDYDIGTKFGNYTRTPVLKTITTLDTAGRIVLAVQHGMQISVVGLTFHDRIIDHGIRGVNPADHIRILCLQAGKVNFNGTGIGSFFQVRDRFFIAILFFLYILIRSLTVFGCSGMVLQKDFQEIIPAEQENGCKDHKQEFCQYIFHICTSLFCGVFHLPHSGKYNIFRYRRAIPGKIRIVFELSFQIRSWTRFTSSEVPDRLGDN